MGRQSNNPVDQASKLSRFALRFIVNIRLIDWLFSLHSRKRSASQRAQEKPQAARCGDRVLDQAEGAQAAAGRDGGTGRDGVRREHASSLRRPSDPGKAQEAQTRVAQSGRLLPEKGPQACRRAQAAGGRVREAVRFTLATPRVDHAGAKRQARRHSNAERHAGQFSRTSAVIHVLFTHNDDTFHGTHAHSALTTSYLFGLSLYYHCTEKYSQIDATNRHTSNCQTAAWPAEWATT